MPRGFYSRQQIAQIAENVLGAPLRGGSEQGIDAVSATPNYQVGSRLMIGARVFHYAKAGGSLIPDMGAKVKNPQDVSQEVLGAAATKGDTSLVLTLDNTDGPSYNGLLPADYLKGGYAVVFPAAGNKAFVRGILSNTAVTVNPGTATFTVTLDAPIPLNLTTSDLAEAMASPYACVAPNTATKLQDNLCTSIGVPTVPAVSGDYLWIQTWGPCWVAPHAGLGTGASNRAAYFVGDGALADEADATPIEQIAGFVLANDKGGGQGAPFVMLMIDP
jgi:hypothetical protein